MRAAGASGGGSWLAQGLAPGVSAADEAMHITLKMAVALAGLCALCAAGGMRHKLARRLSVNAAHVAFAVQRGSWSVAGAGGARLVPAAPKGWAAEADVAVEAAAEEAEAEEDDASGGKGGEGYIEASGRLPLEEEEEDDDDDDHRLHSQAHSLGMRASRGAPTRLQHSPPTPPPPAPRSSSCSRATVNGHSKWGAGNGGNGSGYGSGDGAAMSTRGTSGTRHEYQLDLEDNNDRRTTGPRRKPPPPPMAAARHRGADLQMD